jgi:Uma2 family endonuclease
MGVPAEKVTRSVHDDLADVPEHQIAEVIHGALHVFPRPAITHARTSSRLGVKLGGPFDLGEGGPGGWHLLDEPELSLGPAGREDILVPDLAGWRTTRVPKLPRKARIDLAPDWVCEVLSLRTEAIDRAEKMPIYAREGVAHAWLVHPLRRTLEAFALGQDRRWTVVEVHRGDKRVRVEPFAELELDLAILWPDDDEPAEDEADEAPPRPAQPKKTSAKPRKPSRK